MATIYQEFQNERELYQSYMPFLKNGGLFVKTNDPFELGDAVTLEIMLPDALEKLTLEAVVCWLTPQGAHNGTPAGVGLSFNGDKHGVREQIEKVLGRMLISKEPTHTM